MTARERLIEGGYVPVNLTAGNVTVGDEVATASMLFGELVEITKNGEYKVQFDADESGDEAMTYSAADFESFFLVDKRKKV